ncbi:MAG: hypothetical protein Q8R40_00745 [bacterium]|nr:hypothetical protein [bacterium]
MLKNLAVVILSVAVFTLPGCATLFGPSKAQIQAEIQAGIEEARVKQEGKTRCRYSYRESDDHTGKNKRWSKSRVCNGDKEIVGEPTIPESRDVIVTPQ